MPKNPEFNLPPHSKLTHKPEGKLWFRIDETRFHPLFFDKLGNPTMSPYFGCAWVETAEGGEFVCNGFILLRLVGDDIYTGDFFSTWEEVMK
ncbi:MAG TPA: hypothetical protein VD999_05985 [Vitreimonas sp.]|nr:hypothetical protein [Vitreimonas sp.]